MAGDEDALASSLAKATFRLHCETVRLISESNQQALPLPLRSKTILTVLAASAPPWPRLGATGEKRSLESGDPFSLQNALRFAAQAAEEGSGAWGDSNWHDFEGRERSILLLNALDPDLIAFRSTVQDLRPNLVLIGAMTLCLPGAVAMAQCVREEMGDGAFIVLGGKHVNETVFVRDGALMHHPGSPLLHMKQGKIPHLFDLLVSGDGEEVILQVGELVSQVLESKQPVGQVRHHLLTLEGARGSWVAAWLDQGTVHWTRGTRGHLPYDSFLTPAELFGIHANFPVLERDLTAHTFSDVGKGCIYNCFFCSERSSINNINLPLDAAPERLAKQFQAIETLAKKRYGGDLPSAFVEDSILLGGAVRSWGTFRRLLEMKGVSLPFGGQMTTDLLLDSKRQKEINRLHQCGLRYVFWGLETGQEEIANAMSKNVGRSSWLERNQRVLEFLTETGIRSGISLIFGLGESQADRIQLLEQIQRWQLELGAPNVVSCNWAVQHPLQGEDDGAGYDYLGWGTPSTSPYLDLLWEHFGEASERYGLPGQKLPPIDQLEDLCLLTRQVTSIATHAPKSCGSK